MGQILVAGGEPEANLGRAVEAVRDAAARGCRLVVLPECLDLGWTDPSAQHLAQPIPGPHSQRLSQAAVQHGVYLVAGLVAPGAASGRQHRHLRLVHADEGSGAMPQPPAGPIPHASRRPAALRAVPTGS